MATDSTGPWRDSAEAARTAALLDELHLLTNDEFLAIDGHLLRRAHITRVHVTVEGATFQLLDGSALTSRCSLEELKRLLNLD